MFSRSVLARATMRRLAVPATRSFSRTLSLRLEESQRGTQFNVASDTVPVVTYHDGLRTEHQLHVTPPTEATLASALPAEDLKRRAQALKAELITSLPPTIQRFTVTGRVAVITGYVIYGL
jgi:hypothetical protein